MKFFLLLILLAAPSLRAELASHQPWLGGALPVEVVPYKEVDAKLSSRLRSGIPVWGTRVDCGLGEFPVIGGAMVGLEWNWSGEQGRLLQFEVRLRPEWLSPLIDAVYAEIPYKSATQLGDHGVGLIKGFSLGDWEIAVNSGVELFQAAGANPAWDNRLGIRSPYLTWALQAGLDAAWLSGEAQPRVTPQLFINLPGDVSIHGGVTLSQAEPLWSFLLSYELFPNP